MRGVVIYILAGVALILSGCASPRWQVKPSEYSFRRRDRKADDFLARNTILIDTQTGKTWMMTPSETRGVSDYCWVELPKKR